MHYARIAICDFTSEQKSEVQDIVCRFVQGQAYPIFTAQDVYVELGRREKLRTKKNRAFTLVAKFLLDDIAQICTEMYESEGTPVPYRTDFHTYARLGSGLRCVYFALTSAQLTEVKRLG